MGKETLAESFCNLQNKLHRLACRLLRDELEAQDAVQDAFCNFLQSSLPDSDEETHRRLFVILKNGCLNKIRRRQPHVSLDGLEIGDVSQDYDEAEKIQSLLIEALTPMQRKIYSLFVVEGLGYEEISKKLNISVEAARMNMSRIRRKIKELYRSI